MYTCIYIFIYIFWGYKVYWDNALHFTCSWHARYDLLCITIIHTCVLLCSQIFRLHSKTWKINFIQFISLTQSMWWYTRYIIHACIYICKQLLIKYQRCRINYRKSEKRVSRNYSERTNWFINLNYYNELTELFEFRKRSSIHNIFI